MSNDKSKSYACYGSGQPLKTWEFDLHQFSDDDVEIQITNSGVCHSDVHTIDGDWGDQKWPIVPGHEIVGIVTRVGANVTRFKVGDRAGVGPQALSCGKCKHCSEGHENYCSEGITETYGHKLPDGYITKGGYARYHRVHNRYAIPIPDGLPSDATAPLLCAGVTVYTPLSYLNVKPGMRVGIVGVGGLGHLAIKFAAAWGAEVTAISSSPHKKADAEQFGAKRFLVSTDPEQVKNHKWYFDVILNTVSAPIDWDMLLDMLQHRGHLSTVGAPPGASKLDHFKLLYRGISLHGTLIGSPSEQEEMLKFCAKHNILPKIQTMHWSKCNEACQLVRENKAFYRVVLEVDDN